MVIRVTFFILMALGLIGFGTVAWLSTRPPPPPVTAAEAAVPATVTVLVAANAVRAGSLLKSADLAAKEVTPEAAGTDSNPNKPEVRRSLVGAMVLRSLAPDEVLRSADVMRVGDHGFLAAVLQPGMRAVTVGVDAITGSAGLIWPGDRVDLILTQSIGEGAQPAGRRVAAETVLSDVRVIAIDQELVQGAEQSDKASRGSTVTLEVTQTQAEHVSVAIRLGRLSLSVRSAGMSPMRSAGTEPQPATTWARDVSPALANETPAKTESVMRIFLGIGDAKEFRFQ
jgi:pilus assembly protein CpaB